MPGLRKLTGPARVKKTYRACPPLCQAETRPRAACLRLTKDEMPRKLWKSFLKNLKNFFDKINKGKGRIIYPTLHSVSNFLSHCSIPKCLLHDWFKRVTFRRQSNSRTEADVELLLYLSWSRVSCCPQRGSRPRYRPRHMYILRTYRSALGKYC